MVLEESIQEPALDMAELLSRVEGDYDLLQDVFDIFNEEFPKSYRSLTEALASNDLKQVQFSAHTLKGMLSSLSFVRASSCARRIEHMARSTQPDGIEQEIVRLKSIAYDAQDTLRHVCGEAHR